MSARPNTFKRKEVSFPLTLGIIMLAITVLLYVLGVFSFASSSAGLIDEENRVTVDGVSNITQYLTSMVIHTPNSNETITLSYDNDLNALRIKGGLNTKGIVI